MQKSQSEIVNNVEKAVSRGGGGQLGLGMFFPFFFFILKILKILSEIYF